MLAEKLVPQAISQILVNLLKLPFYFKLVSLLYLLQLYMYPKDMFGLE
jgi:hypothetical protein